MRVVKDLSLYVISMFVVSMAVGKDIIENNAEIINLSSDSDKTANTTLVYNGTVYVAKGNSSMSTWLNDCINLTKQQIKAENKSALASLKTANETYTSS